MNQSPIFICGCPRSGTTLFRMLADSHPNLAIAPESSYLFIYKDLVPSFFYGNLSEKKDVENLVKDLLKIRRVKDWFPAEKSYKDVLVRLDEKSGYADIVSAFFDIYAEYRGKPRWGDKTPKNLLRIDAIRKLYPDGKIVVVVRDGRDVALSLRNVDFGHISFFASALIWNSYMKKLEWLLNHDENILIVKYEDLLDNPEKEMRRFCEYVDEKYDEDLMKKYLGHGDDVSHSKSKFYGQQINPANKAKWKKKCKPWELKVFETVNATYLKKYGYELSGLKQYPNYFVGFFKILKKLENIKRLILRPAYNANYFGFLKIVVSRGWKRLIRAR